MVTIISITEIAMETALLISGPEGRAATIAITDTSKRRLRYTVDRMFAPFVHRVFGQHAKLPHQVSHSTYRIFEAGGSIRSLSPSPTFPSLSCDGEAIFQTFCPHAFYSSHAC
mmetsp:Transcript_6621/g.16143  ORF Transcript_6621/g.16143 Transcript_6621/m.16143 type:complete len:113 (-) Transcript_6621:123-461(-)